MSENGNETVMKTIKKNFWRLVYHMLCCCCFSDQNLKYSIPKHYLVDTPDQTVEEITD